VFRVAHLPLCVRRKWPQYVVRGPGGPHWRLGRTRGESVFYPFW